MKNVKANIMQSVQQILLEVLIVKTKVILLKMLQKLNILVPWKTYFESIVMYRVFCEELIS